MKTQLMVLLLGIYGFTAQAQLQNADFENWNKPVTAAYSSNSPVGWAWTDGVIFVPSDFYYPTATSSHSGNYALTLGVWYNYTKDAAIQTAAISTRPGQLTGYYKYTDNQIQGPSVTVTDTAEVSIYLTRWDASLGRRDTVGQGLTALNESIDFRKFTVRVNYRSAAMPDSVTVYLDPSLIKRGDAGGSFLVTGTGTASFFTVDHLALEAGGLNINPLSLPEAIKVYPNPGSDMIYLPGFEGQLSISSMNGMILLSRDLHTGQGFPVADLPAAMYILTLNDGRSVQHTTWVKNL